MFGGDEPAPEEATETERPSEDGGSESAAAPEAQPGTIDAVDAAIAAEWNAIRTRLRDPVILGHAEEFAAGAGVAADIFERFEAASGEHNAHETLEETSESSYEGFEEADREAYEGFETALEEYVGALDSGSEADAAAGRFGRAALRAQFAVAGAPGAAPEAGTAPEDHSGEQADLEGGPDVVAGVPDDADHVVDMQAVAFEPEALTVEQGETVAWAHAAGEPHSVSAYEDGIPGDATYWASGGFESEEAAREGWENGRGAVQSGESHVHTFETPGEHGYFCIPHEAAGIIDTVVVE